VDPLSGVVPWGWGDLFLTIGVFIGIGLGTGIVIAFCIGLFQPLTNGLMDSLGGWGLSRTLLGISGFSLLFYAALAVAMYLCVFRKYGLSLEEVGFRPVKLSDYGLALGVWIAVMIVGAIATAIVVQLFFGSFTNPQDQTYTNTGAGRSVASLLLLCVSVAGIVAPIEELFFRGLLYPLLRRRLRVPLALPAAALIFALCHGIPILIPFLWALGAGLTFLFVRTRSLYPGILMHAAQNTVFAITIWAAFSG
jgi:membrane protease YdiL (CAAX protease family)